MALGLLLVDAASREAILFDDTRLLPARLSDTELERELASAWLADLGVRKEAIR